MTSHDITIGSGPFGGTTITRTAETAEREAEFERTHVSKYELPKKLEKARTTGAEKVSVPLAVLDRLVARVETVRAAQNAEVAA